MRMLDFESLERPLENGPEFRDVNEIIQFKNGLTAMLMRSIGQTLSWRLQKHARPENVDNCTIVSMDDGRRIAVGAGVLAFLPELDLEYGRFVGDHAPSDHGINALEIEEASPDGLPDVVVGEEWLLNDSKVNSVMVRYKGMLEGSGCLQVDMVTSPLESAQHILHLKSDSLIISKEGELFVPSPPPLTEELTLPIPNKDLG